MGAPEGRCGDAPWRSGAVGWFSFAARYHGGPFPLLQAPMTSLPDCPVCGMGNTYPDGAALVCADCGHEWSPDAATAADDDAAAPVRDANGNALQDGDDVVLVKDLKVKGSSLVLKMGTKVRGIRVVGGDHDVEGRVDGSPMMLKSVYLKKV